MLCEKSRKELSIGREKSSKTELTPTQMSEQAEKGIKAVFTPCPWLRLKQQRVLKEDEDERPAATHERRMCETREAE